MKKDQDIQGKKELREFIRRKCKTTFPLGYFSKLDHKLDYVGFKFVKGETICSRPGLQMVIVRYNLGHSLSLGLNDGKGKAQTRNNL